jgi:hypothetical protein
MAFTLSERSILNTLAMAVAVFLTSSGNTFVGNSALSRGQVFGKTFFTFITVMSRVVSFAPAEGLLISAFFAY